jgi:hypothetical protein
MNTNCAFYEVINEFLYSIYIRSPISVTARSKAWVYGRSLAGIAGSNRCLSLVSVVCYQVDVYA